MENTTLKVRDFSCNDPTTCECESQACAEFLSGTFDAPWDNYCRSASKWNAVWVMAKACSRGGWSGGESAAFNMCWRFGRECEVWDRAGARCP